MNFKQENNPTTKITTEEAGDNMRAVDLDLKEVDGTTYFDQDDDQWGQGIDEATGESYSKKNSGEGEDLATLNVNEPGSLEEQEKKVDKEFENDEAAQFLKQFDAENN